MRRFLTAAALAALIFSTGCAPKVTTNYEPKVVIKVVNRNWADATVYLIQEGGARYRVGFVTSNNTRMFKMPIGARPYSTSYFYVDFVGGETYTHSRDLFIIYPNTVVEFYIGHLPQYSYIFIYEK